MNYEIGEIIILNNKEYLEQIYSQGAENARDLASKTLENVKNKKTT